MDTTKFETSFTYEKLKESIEGIMLIGLIGHFTGYRPPNNDEEIEDTMADLDVLMDNIVEGIIEQMDEEEIHEMIESSDDGMDIFKKEILALMKRMETV